MTAILPRKNIVTLAQSGPPKPPVRPAAGRKPASAPPSAKPAPRQRDSGVWPPTREPVIRWWNDSMQDNLQKPGPMQWLGRAQLVGSPLAMLVLGPVEALLVLLRQPPADV